MINRGLYIAFVLTLVICFFPGADADAQCVMCKAVAEESAKSDPAQNSAGAGINAGILYIIGIPYILLMLFFGYYFRGKITDFAREMGVLKK